ncbi:low-complexity tail membrane protein [Pseudanabaena sp. UWO311]|uniref:low-complexity tail membrane protein n=1 Tax=Pseudanabaena sp. UWO311 TaxID=2487337 RepID=UPI00115A148E|nr:low-complexity tail membrane protein [Pseudanabaena sp. UWO311]TYQ27014.1 low-complexity tail membrane protein [Pseudanabaena sp. UWO311]
MTSPLPPNPTSNISLGNNPFIWGNIALLAIVPWLLVLSMAGLAVGDPVFPEWFEIFLLGFPAIALVAWIQWQQPLSPFSLWFVAKPSESLSDQERQILTLVKQHSNGWYVTGWIATAVAIVMSAVFCKIYISAPLAQEIAPFPAGLRLFGILWAEICFLLSNILLQAGISALRIKLTAETDFRGLQPFAPEKIKNSFTNIGWQSRQILKFFEEDAVITPVSDESPKVEIADLSPDVKESQEFPDAEAIEPSNFVAEVETEAVSDINALVEDTVSEPGAIADIAEEVIAEPLEFVEDSEPEINALTEDKVSEPEAIADITEDPIAEPLEFVEDSEVVESFDSLESKEILSELENETIPQEEIIQEPEELEPIKFLASPEIEALDIADTSSEPELESETNTEVADVSLDNEFVEELEISVIVAEESITETISETDSEQFTEENQTETSLDEELYQTEEFEPAEIVEEIENKQFFDITDPISEPESTTVLDVADVSLDEQLIEEDGESLTETISETEIEQFIEAPQIETILNQEIVQENEELNPFELVEDEKSNIEVLDSTEDESNLNEEIIEEYEELEAFETPEEPELTFLEGLEVNPESRIEENEKTEGNLYLSNDILENQFTEDCEELESLETTEGSEAEEISNTILTNDGKRSLDFLKKSRKTGIAQKKQGFGKPIKRDIVSSSDAVEPNEYIQAVEQDAISDPIIEIESALELPDPTSATEMIQEIDEEINLEAIAAPIIEQDIEATEIKTPDFDDELDELIAFNAYVENILREYLEDNNEEPKNEEFLDQASPEQVDPSIVFDPAIESIAIAKESVEAVSKNLPDLEAQIPADVTEEISRNEQSPKNPEYWVQELLVDKFFARIEALNIADKANKAATDQTIENISETAPEIAPEIDEFADLEALLDGKPEHPDPMI